VLVVAREVDRGHAAVAEFALDVVLGLRRKLLTALKIRRAGRG